MWLALLIPATILIGLLIFVALLSRHHKSATGKLNLIGSIGSVTTPLTPQGVVLINGELWPACSLSGQSIPDGRRNVRIVGCRAHLLEVELV